MQYFGIIRVFYAFHLILRFVPEHGENGGPEDELAVFVAIAATRDYGERSIDATFSTIGVVHKFFDVGKGHFNRCSCHWRRNLVQVENEGLLIPYALIQLEIE